MIIDTENGLPYFTPIWRRKPSICLVHHVHTDQWQTRFPAPAAAVCRYLETPVMPAVYRNRTFVAISRSTAEDLQAIGLPAENIRIIESGVDVPPGEIPEKSQVPLFVSLNRLVPHKRIHLLLEAWEIACQILEGWWFWEMGPSSKISVDKRRLFPESKSWAGFLRERSRDF